MSASARAPFLQALADLAAFVGLPRSAGILFGVLVLADKPLSLDELAQKARVSKGAASMGARSLVDLSMARRSRPLGDRRDYYTAESDFWVIVKQLLASRRRPLDQALARLDQSLDQAEQAGLPEADPIRAARDFLVQLDNLVSLATALDPAQLEGLAIWLSGSGGPAFGARNESGT